MLTGVQVWHNTDFLTSHCCFLLLVLISRFLLELRNVHCVARCSFWHQEIYNMITYMYDRKLLGRYGVHFGQRRQRAFKFSVNIPNVHSKILQIFLMMCLYVNSELVSWLVKWEKEYILTKTHTQKMKFSLTLLLGSGVRWGCGHNTEELKIIDRNEMKSWQRISKPVFRSLPEYEINFPCERIDLFHMWVDALMFTLWTVL